MDTCPEKDKKAGLLLKAPLVTRNFSGWNEAGPGIAQGHDGWSGAVRELWSPQEELAQMIMAAYPGQQTEMASWHMSPKL